MPAKEEKSLTAKFAVDAKEGHLSQPRRECEDIAKYGMATCETAPPGPPLALSWLTRGEIDYVSFAPSAVGLSCAFLGVLCVHRGEAL